MTQEPTAAEGGKPTAYELWLLRAAADPSLALKRHRRGRSGGGTEVMYLSLSATDDTTPHQFFSARKAAVSRLLGSTRGWLRAVEREQVESNTDGAEGEVAEVVTRLILTDAGRAALTAAEGRRAARPKEAYSSVAELLATLAEEHAVRTVVEAERAERSRRAAEKRQRSIRWRREDDGMNTYVDPLDENEVSAAQAAGFAPVPPLLQRKPSEVDDLPWVYACARRDGDYPQTTERGGKWMVFVPKAGLDDAWEKVKTALADGRLGRSAKCSTAMPSPNAPNPNFGVIIRPYRQ